MDTTPLVRPVEAADAAAWLDMRCALWPDGSREEHDSEIDEFLAGNAPRLDAVFIAADHGQAVGFVEVAIRPYAEECYSGKVSYLEGWYVVPGARRKGIGLALVRSAEHWARLQGCSEMASDPYLTNAPSLSAHLAAGFTEVAQIRCFRKTL